MKGLLVSDCLLQSKSAAIKIGSETRGNISALRFEHIQVVHARSPKVGSRLHVIW